MKSERVLGLSTFFACKVLFQQDSCKDAKSGILTAENANLARRWCCKAQVRNTTNSFRDNTDGLIETFSSSNMGLCFHSNQ